MKIISFLLVAFVSVLNLKTVSQASDNFRRSSSDGSVGTPEKRRVFITVPSREDVLTAAEEIGVRGHALEELTSMPDWIFRTETCQPSESAGMMVVRWNSLFKLLEGQNEQVHAHTCFLWRQTNEHVLSPTSLAKFIMNQE